LDSRRTPYHVAISRDDGQPWENVKILEDDPDGWYCYTAIVFQGDVLLGHVVGDRDEGKLSTTQITSFDVEWLYY
jgi:sialidase-1